MKTNVKVALSVRNDADNWYDACNSISHGTDWKQRVSVDLRDKITGKTKKEAFDFLMPYLEDLYKERDLEKLRAQNQDFFDENISEIFKRLAKLTKHPICKDKITLFITTFPRCPFNFGKGYIWIPAVEDTKRLTKILTHEMLHFQYFAYYSDKVEQAVGHKKSEWFREAMTPLLNEYFGDLTGNIERTYPVYEDLWGKLSETWKETKDFDEFIDKGIILLKSYELKQ